jgi:hypothetical protein
MENARLLDELRQRTDEVTGLHGGLEARVAEQVEELVLLSHKIFYGVLGWVATAKCSI